MSLSRVYLGGKKALNYLLHSQSETELSARTFGQGVVRTRFSSLPPFDEVPILSTCFITSFSRLMTMERNKGPRAATASDRVRHTSPDRSLGTAFDICAGSRGMTVVCFSLFAA